MVTTSHPEWDHPKCTCSKLFSVPRNDPSVNLIKTCPNTRCLSWASRVKNACFLCPLSNFGIVAMFGMYHVPWETRKNRSLLLVSSLYNRSHHQSPVQHMYRPDLRISYPSTEHMSYFQSLICGGID